METKNENLVSLSIGKEVVTPIVEQHIKAAVLEAFGGRDAIIEKFIKEIIYKQVNENGEVPRYSSDKTYNWIDIMLSKQIKDYIMKELSDITTTASLKIKNALIAKLKTDKGALLVADALLDGLTGNFNNKWMTKLDIKFEKKGNG